MSQNRKESAELNAGRKVGLDRYSLIKWLGQGGMGVVWLAQDEHLGELVALKFLPPQISRDVLALNDLRRETKRNRKLAHPHIMRIHDFHESEGQEPFISMEYVDGPNLASLRAEQPNRIFTWQFLRPLVGQLCEALDYAHGEKIIHRDLKPANLMLDGRGRLKLTDFGIAAVVSESMSRVSVQSPSSGTLIYMSPQQLDGKAPRATDDIYSMGATLYELLTGKQPFYSGDICDQIRHLAPDPLDQRLTDLELKNEIPADVSAMIMACLAKDPEQRPQSAGAVAQWIQITEEPVQKVNLAPVIESPSIENPSIETPSIHPPSEPEERAKPEVEKVESAIRPQFKHAWEIGVCLLLVAGVFGGWYLGKHQALTSQPFSAPQRDPQKPWTVAELAMEMVYIAPGSFTMGSPLDEQDRDHDEGPQTEVVITRGFWMGKCEVSQKQYELVMGVNPSWFKGDLNRPVEGVSWFDAVDFARKLTSQNEKAGRLPEGYGYRIPTEAEWEYACRAGSKTRFSYGDDLAYSALGNHAWFENNSQGSPHPAGVKLPNPWGLLDMHGGIREWCYDSPTVYPGGKVIDPVGSEANSDRAFRGGGWDGAGKYCRSAYRYVTSPNYRSDSLGFRLVLGPVLP